MRRRVAYARDYGDHIMGKFKFPTAYTILLRADLRYVRGNDLDCTCGKISDGDKCRTGKGSSCCRHLRTC